MPKIRKIHEIPELDRPREKLQRRGVQSLSDFELLEVMIGSGNKEADVGQIARQILKLFRTGSHAVNLESLLTLKGVSTAHAAKILAGLELAKRHLVRDTEPLLTHDDILQRLVDIRTKSQEYFVCLSLDGGQRLIAQRTVTIGTLDTVLAHPREVFADPIADRAASIVVAHNHPSGNAQPSKTDVMITQQLTTAGHLLGVPLRDHIIVTKTDYFSYRQQHLF